MQNGPHIHVRYRLLSFVRRLLGNHNEVVTTYHCNKNRKTPLLGVICLCCKNHAISDNRHLSLSLILIASIIVAKRPSGNQWEGDYLHQNNKCDAYDRCLENRNDLTGANRWEEVALSPLLQMLISKVTVNMYLFRQLTFSPLSTFRHSPSLIVKVVLDLNLSVLIPFFLQTAGGILSDAIRFLRMMR